MCTRIIHPEQQRFLFILLLTAIGLNLSGQPKFKFYSEAAENSVSDGLYLRSALFASYKAGKNHLGAGFENCLLNGNGIILSGYVLYAARDFTTGNAILNLKVFHLWTASSDILQQTNSGCSLSASLKHFEILVGTNFRTFSLRKKAYDEPGTVENSGAIHENLNLMYSICFNINSFYARWNAGLTVTNTDYFLINQETNPYFNLHGSYKINHKVCLFAEAWYKNAGLFNLSANYFGFIMRGGITWKF